MDVLRLPVNAPAYPVQVARCVPAAVRLLLHTQARGPLLLHPSALCGSTPSADWSSATAAAPPNPLHQPSTTAFGLNRRYLVLFRRFLWPALTPGSADSIYWIGHLLLPISVKK